MKKVALLFFISLSLFNANQSLANGGDQRIVEGKYLINLSRAPFTPRVGVKTSFLASFVDIQKNKLIGEDLILRIRISKLGEAPKGNFIFEQKNVSVKGGVLDFPYTFIDTGLHEIFFDFAFASNPQQAYHAPDFLIDVQEPRNEYTINKILLAVFGSFTIGLMTGWFVKRIVGGKAE